MEEDMSGNIDAREEHSHVKAFVTLAVALCIIIAVSLVWGASEGDMAGDSWSDPHGYDYGECNVAAYALHGPVVTFYADNGYEDEYLEDWQIIQLSSEELVGAIEAADQDENIKAIVLEVDSYGGSPVAGEEIANALLRASKPTIALIREAGVSAAYYAASGADAIFASQHSIVGSIGVTMSYVDNVDWNEREGYTYNSLSSGKFKDTGDPNRPLSEEEVDLLRRDLAIMHENFVEDVARNRGLSVAEVAALADGSSILGEAALESGLIDRIGDIASVEAYLEESFGEEVSICWNY